MKNITLALAIALGFCASEAVAQTSTRLRRNLLDGSNRSALAAPSAVEQPTNVLNGSDYDVSDYVEPEIFDESKKMSYQDAVEKAKVNDSDACYWLAYYLSRGEGVNTDGTAAWQFLERSSALGNPYANYAMGVIHEFCSFGGSWHGWSSCNGGVRLRGSKKNDKYRVWYKGSYFESDCAGVVSYWTSVSNQIAVAYVDSLYHKAIDGGITNAVKDVERFRRKIEDRKCRLAKQHEDKRKALEKKRARDEETKKALTLLNGKSDEELEEQSRREKKEAEEKAERELWATWPKDANWGDADIVKMCEEEFKVVFHGEKNSGWKWGCGKCFIDGGGDGVAHCHWKKYNSDGVLIRAASYEVYAEYIWMTNRAACVTIENRKKWASEHGMSYDEAISKSTKLSDKMRKFRMEEALKRMREAEKEARLAAERAAEKAARVAAKEKSE